LFQPEIIEKLPSPYDAEIRGIAKATGIPDGEILLFNIFYEIFTVCTSIVAQDKKGLPSVAVVYPCFPQLAVLR